MPDTSAHDAIEGKVFANQTMRLATLNALARERQATLEVETTDQDNDGRWKWIKGIFGDCWSPRDKPKIKTRARLVSDWIEVEDAQHWAAISKVHHPMGNEGYCSCGTYQCNQMLLSREARSV